jgi:hypothetical protein
MLFVLFCVFITGISTFVEVNRRHTFNITFNVRNSEVHVAVSQSRTSRRCSILRHVDTCDVTNLKEPVTWLILVWAFRGSAYNNCVTNSQACASTIQGHVSKVINTLKTEINMQYKQCSLRRGSAAARLLGLRVRIPPGVWLSLRSVVSYHVEVSASGWSFVQRSPIKCSVCECDREASIMRRPWPTGGCCDMEKSIYINFELVPRSKHTPSQLYKPVS